MSMVAPKRIHYHALAGYTPLRHPQPSNAPLQADLFGLASHSDQPASPTSFNVNNDFTWPRKASPLIAWALHRAKPTKDSIQTTFGLLPSAVPMRGRPTGRLAGCSLNAFELLIRRNRPLAPLHSCAVLMQLCRVVATAVVAAAATIHQEIWLRAKLPDQIPSLH